MATLGDDLAGLLLGDRYRIVRLLGRGGMGAVFVARDERLGEDVALKVVREALLDDHSALERFKREARLLPELVHEHIVRAYGAGDDNGLLWIAMELLEGTTLRARIEERGRMSWRESLPIVRQIAGALAAAHDKGVIHRDLKPDNVMFVGKSEPGVEPDVRLLDFGVAKGVQREGSAASMTGTGMMIGTPGYIAPEVIVEGKGDEPRSDLYALGVLWFELVTGARPFTAKTPVALAMAHAHQPAPSPSSIMPFHPLPAPIDRLILRLLSKQPEDRPSSARDLITLLDRIEGEATLAEQAPTEASLAQASFPTITDVSRTPTFTPGPMAAVDPGATARMPTPATAAVPPTRLERIPSGVVKAPVPATTGVHMTPKMLAGLGAGVVALMFIGVVGALAYVDARRDPPPAPAPAPTDVAAPAPVPPQEPVIQAPPTSVPESGSPEAPPTKASPKKPKGNGVGTGASKPSPATAPTPPPAPTSLTLRVSPRSAADSITLDGRLLLLPLGAEPVSPGRHTFTLKTAQHEFTRTIDIPAGSGARVELKYDAIAGTLTETNK